MLAWGLGCVGRRGARASPHAPVNSGALSFAAVLVHQSATVNGIKGIALTNLDVLDGFEALKVCVGYKLNGEMYDRLPAGTSAQA